WRFPTTWVISPLPTLRWSHTLLGTSHAVAPPVHRDIGWCCRCCAQLGTLATSRCACQRERSRRSTTYSRRHPALWSRDGGFSRLPARTWFRAIDDLRF